MQKIYLYNKEDKIIKSHTINILIGDISLLSDCFH